MAKLRLQAHADELQQELEQGVAAVQQEQAEQVELQQGLTALGQVRSRGRRAKEPLPHYASCRLELEMCSCVLPKCFRFTALPQARLPPTQTPPALPSPLGRRPRPSAAMSAASSLR